MASALPPITIPRGDLKEQPFLQCGLVVPVDPSGCTCPASDMLAEGWVCKCGAKDESSRSADDDT